MANPVLSAELSGARNIFLTWTYGSNADFKVFWKSNLPAGQDFMVLGTTSYFFYNTPDLDPKKIYYFFVRAHLGETYEESNLVELFVSCGKGVVIAIPQLQ